jgi:hypothetical protein
VKNKLLLISLVAILALSMGLISCTDSVVTYDLTVASTTGGSTTPGESTYAYNPGTVVALVAQPDEGYQFVNWTGDVSTIANVNSASTTITMNGDYTVVANFVMIATYYLTVSSSAGGSVTTPGEGTFTYDEGTVVNLMASPDECYHFVNWTGDVDTIGDARDATATITLNEDHTITANFDYTPMVSAGGFHTVGLKSDGIVLAVGRNDHGQCNVNGWTGIIQVAAGATHTAGLKSDGTVIALGWNYFGECDVDDWTGIVQITAGVYHTVGLESDGTVVAAGWNHFRQCEVGSWTDIIQVAAGAHHTVGLKKDGTVVAIGRPDEKQHDVGDWTDIIWIGAGSTHTVGLKSDGTAVAVGWNYYGECDVAGWDLN